MKTTKSAKLTMKTYICFLIPMLLLPPFVQAQDATEKAVEQVKEAAKSPEVKSILYDPRIRNITRSIKETSGGTINTIKENPEEAVRSATALFQKELDKNGTSTEEMAGKATKELEKLSTKAGIPTVTEVPAVRRPPAATRTATPPAVRSAVTAAKTSLPGNSGMIAPNGGIVETATPARPIEPGFSPSLVMGGEVPSLIPDTQALSEKNIPAPKALKPSYAAARKSSGTNQEAMSIRARNSVMDKKNRIVTFTGDVYAKSDADRITMECDKLQIHLTPEGANVKDVDGKPTQITKVIATGGTVKIRKMDPTGKVQTALARRIDYDAISKDAMLSGGPPSLKDGGKSIKTETEDSKILLRGNGKYEIIGSGRDYFSIPLKGGKKLSKDLDSSSGGANKFQ